MKKTFDISKTLTPQKRFLNNKQIVIIKIFAACLLFFACCLFFFQNLEMFLDDLKHFNLFPIIFFIGIIWVCSYIANLVGHIEDKNLYLADRYDWLYKIFFVITVLSMIIRSFFAEPYLSVSTVITTIGIVSGVITYLTPKIIDNNNDEF